MDVDEFIAKAWRAVEKAGIPEAAQAVAFKEAAGFLAGDGESDRTKPADDRKRSGRANRKPVQQAKENGDAPVVDDTDAFFAQLADEAGVDEAKLRDVLQLKGGTIHVLPATRKFGDTRANQARQIVALVAGAYAHGLDKSPVDAVAVREEVKRKRCFDSANFAAQLKSMEGYSQGLNRNEIVAGSKWLGEFQRAMKLATGETDSEES